MPIETVNPATGVTVETFEPHDAFEVERRIAQAFEAAQIMRTTGYSRRAEWMHATADILEGDLERSAAMITLEMGKPIAQARAEVLKCVKNIRFYADHAESFLAAEELLDPASVAASAAGTVWQPLGVVLAVMPWNYPLWQVIRFAAPARWRATPACSSMRPMCPARHCIWMSCSKGAASPPDHSAHC